MIPYVLRPSSAVYSVFHLCYFVHSAINNMESTEENAMGLSSRSLNEGIFYFLTHKNVRAACVCTLDIYDIHTDN